MDGIIVLDKPRGLSSASALYRVRDITGVQKSGHAGTLDPLAEGVLILCLGRATKLVEAFMDQPKVYWSQARLDVTSTSYDLERPLTEVTVPLPPSLEQIQESARAIEAMTEQMPPKVSALKIRGRPAYRLERKGRPVELEARAVQIYWLHIERYDWPLIEFEMACGRGTYVRAVIRDLGEKLGAGGCLTALARTAIGPYHRRNAWTLERLGAAQPSEYLIPIEKAREQLSVRPVEIPSRPS